MIKSASAITYELDDIEAASAELAEQIRGKLELNKECVGILFGQPDMEIRELSLKLNEALGFDIIGGTTAAGALITNDGYHELAVSLLVMTSEDCRFAASISQPMSDNVQEHITATYNQALLKLSKDRQIKPQMMFCIMSLLQSCSTDHCLAVLSETNPELPIFGFVAADDFEFHKQQVYLNGEAGGDRMALLLISGDVKPVFEVKNLAGSHTLAKKKVTKARDNIICEIEGKPAYEYIREFPFIGHENESGVLWNYQFFTEMQDGSDGDGVIISRALNSYDKDSGEITCFADVPEGSYISLIYCDGDDVQASCEEAMAAFHDKLEDAAQKGYQYSTVLIASCSLRNMFLANKKAAEGNVVRNTVHPKLTVSGVYAFGEIAPASVHDTKVFNCFHNATLTICAF